MFNSEESEKNSIENKEFLIKNEKLSLEKLNKEYLKVSGGKCSGCGNCCAESVHTYYIEWINIFRYLSKDKEKFERLTEKVKDFYINEFVRLDSCPFLDDNKMCEIYEVRPLVCRLFGHYSKEEHEDNYNQVQEGNAELAGFLLGEYGINIKPEILNRKIDFCQNFINEEKLNKEQRIEVQEAILNIDSYYFSQGLIDEDSLDMGLVDWVVEYLEEMVEYIEGNTLWDQKIKNSI